MGKLHELLAVEAELKGRANTIVTEAATTFKKRHEHFAEVTRKYEPLVEGEESTTETKAMDSTVPDKLQYVSKHITRYFDVVYQKEVTNTLAKADIIVDGVVLAKDVPATFLLSMEKRIRELIHMYQEIPTLDPGENWEKDLNLKNVYKCDPSITYRTRKVVKYPIKYEATKEHPAQVDTVSVDEKVGKVLTYKKSGAISPADKSTILERLDNLYHGIKQARARANNTEVVKTKIAEAMMAYVNFGRLGNS